MRTLFGTDGVRGLANVEPVTPETALRIGGALARRCRSAGGQRVRVVIGRDTRRSGDLLESALVAGICSMGADVVLAGIVPTPAVAYLTRDLGADAGVVVSASHNPFQDNGIKIFAGDGYKLPDAVEHAIEQAVMEGSGDDVRVTGRDVGTVARLADAGERYARSIQKPFGGDRWLSGVKIVLDCAHGAGFAVGPPLFAALGAATVALGVNPDGSNINDGCGAMHPQALQAAVIREGAHLGLALDGDADRALLVDETGALVDGDEVLAIVAADMLARSTLKDSTVVATVMSNLGLEMALQARGGRLLRTAVGDRYVVEAMRQHGYNLGGEQSGHLIFLDHGTTGDGLLAGLTVARLMMTSGRPLSELRRVMTRLPQTLVNVRVKERRDLDSVPAVRDVIARVSALLNDRGRVLVRYSGTEPLVRVMVEGEAAAQVAVHAQHIADVIQEQLGETSA